MNSIINVFISTAIQYAVFVLLYKVGWIIGSILFYEPENDIFWGLTVHFAHIALISIALLDSILKQFFAKGNLIRIAAIVTFSTLAFALLFTSSYSYVPLRSALLLSSAISAFATLFINVRIGKYS